MIFYRDFTQTASTMKNNITYERLERFIEGEINPDELSLLEGEVKSDTKLRKELALRKMTDKALLSNDISNLRSKLQNIEDTRVAKEREKELVIAKFYKYAASFIGIALLYSTLLLVQKDYSADKIIKKYYESYTAYAPSRSITSGANDNYNIAIEYYNDLDYENASIYFEKVNAINDRFIESTMMLGVSRFENKQYAEAIPSFEKVIKHNDNLFIEDANWYLALCYIQTNERAKAIDQLEKIKNSDSRHKKSANKIIKKYHL